jgi:inorganic pyrophosphatase
MKAPSLAGRTDGDGGHVEAEITIEIPQGSRNKYKMDHAGGRIRLEHALVTPTRYPFNCGFIPATLAEDGDPLDALVLRDESAFPGCTITGRPVGVYWVHDEYGPDAKILAVPARDPRYRNIRNLTDVRSRQRSEIAEFFDSCREPAPRHGTDVQGWQDHDAAEQVIAAARARAGGSVPVGGRVHAFGVGSRARVAATSAADDLRARSVAAVAMFKPGFGGWIVRIYPGGIRERPSDAPER